MSSENRPDEPSAELSAEDVGASSPAAEPRRPRRAEVVLVLIGSAYVIAMPVRDGDYYRAAVFLPGVFLVLYFMTRPAAYYAWAQRQPVRQRIGIVTVLVAAAALSIAGGGAFIVVMPIAAALVCWFDHRMFTAHRDATASAEALDA